MTVSAWRMSSRIIGPRLNELRRIKKLAHKDIMAGTSLSESDVKNAFYGNGTYDAVQAIAMFLDVDSLDLERDGERILEQARLDQASKNAIETTLPPVEEGSSRWAGKSTKKTPREI